MIATTVDLQGKARTMPLCEAKREDIIHSVSEFLGRARPFDVLIVSYETFRIHKGLFLKTNAAAVDLMICDEAHRLKNADSQLSAALNELPCRRRVLLSGTPMQNHLDEACPPSSPSPLVYPHAVVRLHPATPTYPRFAERTDLLLGFAVARAVVNLFPVSCLAIDTLGIHAESCISCRVNPGKYFCALFDQVAASFYEPPVPLSNDQKFCSDNDSVLMSP